MGTRGFGAMRYEESF